MPQNAVAALAEALGRKGPGGRPALPYSEDFRRLLEQHMTELVQVTSRGVWRAERRAGVALP